MKVSTRLLKAASIAVIAGALTPVGAAGAGDRPASETIFLGDSFFDSFSARLADQLESRIRHARRFGGGLHVSGLKGPDPQWNAYRAAAEYNPRAALKILAAEGERDFAREQGKDPFGPPMVLPQGLGIFLLGDTGMGEARPGGGESRDFWTHSISGGMDYRFTDNLMAGFAVSYFGGEADLETSDYLAESITWSLFASLGEGPWYVDGSFNMGTLNFGGEEKGALQPPGSAPPAGTGTGDHVWTHVDTGYTFRFGNLEAGPVAEFRHARARFDRFTEGAGALSVPEREVDYARVGLGAAASVNVNFGERSTVNIWGRATWQTGFGNSDPVIEAALEDGAPFAVRSVEAGRSFVRTRMGFTADLGGGTEADFSYRTDLGRDDWNSHTVAASVRVKF